MDEDENRIQKELGIEFKEIKFEFNSNVSVLHLTFKQELNSNLILVMNCIVGKVVRTFLASKASQVIVLTDASLSYWIHPVQPTIIYIRTYAGVRFSGRTRVCERKFQTPDNAH